MPRRIDAWSISGSDERELTSALDSLVRKRYLSTPGYQVLPLAVEYYRATIDHPVHEIDEAEYWDGN